MCGGGRGFVAFGGGEGFGIRLGMTWIVSTRLSLLLLTANLLLLYSDKKGCSDFPNESHL